MMTRLLLLQARLLLCPHEETERAEAGGCGSVCDVNCSDASTQHRRLWQGLSGLCEACGVVLPNGVEKYHA